MNNQEAAAADSASQFSRRLTEISERISAACRRAGRQASEVTLVGVSKTFPASLVRTAIESGLGVIGENRVQEAADKITELKEVSAQHGVQWHLIGHLQSNKARLALELFDVVETVDSLKLAERLSKIAGESGKVLPIFIEVNLGGEGSKAGVSPEGVLQLCRETSRLDQLQLIGLMAVPPFSDNPEDVRPYFRRLREILQEAQRAGIGGERFKQLSMGMSSDFEVAIEEGATYVRIGTALFGSRK